MLASFSSKRFFGVRPRSLIACLRRRGVSSVEFAFVAPIFFLMLLGLIELSRGLMVKHMLLNAARQGCRIG
ncbi:MAG TPA: TadE family protein, partial [Gemmataceae bacterium]|nr:TadE family protein [Gemmataceae bacterium]